MRPTEMFPTLLPSWYLYTEAPDLRQPALSPLSLLEVAELTRQGSLSHNRASPSSCIHFGMPRPNSECPVAFT